MRKRREPKTINLGSVRIDPRRRKADLTLAAEHREELSQISRAVMLKTGKKPVITATIHREKTVLKGYGIDERDLPHPAVPPEIRAAIRKMLRTIKPGQCVIIIRRIGSDIGSAYKAQVTELN